jgi:hypothetical protein
MSVNDAQIACTAMGVVVPKAALVAILSHWQRRRRDLGKPLLERYRPPPNAFLRLQKEKERKALLANVCLFSLNMSVQLMPATNHSQSWRARQQPRRVNGRKWCERRAPTSSKPLKWLVPNRVPVSARDVCLPARYNCSSLLLLLLCVVVVVVVVVV